MELRDSAGRVLLVLSTRDSFPARVPSLGEGDGAPLPQAFSEFTATDSMAMGRLRQDGDSIAFPVVARVAGPVPGFLVNWRRMSNAPQARESIRRILGTDAAFLFGNRDGSLWSELGKPTATPPEEIRHATSPLRYAGSTGPVMAASGPIDHTPWAFTIEFPIGAILTPANLFLNRLTLIAVLSLALGLVIAWFLSVRITDPLAQLTDAAQRMARGDLSTRVDVTRADELGRLGTSFNAMAAEVEGSRQHLEETVAERTRQLEEAQDSLVRREKVALLGQLASGVGHELRNPLGVISNAVYYLETVQTDAPAKVREYLDIIHRQTVLATRIVNDLLDFSRKPPANPQALPLQHFVEAQVQDVTLNGIVLELDIPGSLPPVVVDPVHAGQVVHNLLINAIQAMGTTGTLQLRGRRDGNSRVRLEVSDTGPGIAPENLNRVFEPLFTTKTRGIGLGLALSRTLAQANGGELSVVSEPGRGATFIFTLPAATG
jgi:signal transduction histidine kinase